MVDSDKSDNGESRTTGKRLHEDNSGDEISEHPSKRPRSKSPELLENIDIKKDLVVQVTNGSALSSEEKTNNVKVDDEQKNGAATAVDDDTDKDDSIKLKLEPAEPDAESGVDVKKVADQEMEGIKGEGKEDESLQDKSEDSEVVDGLELSVECASDKEASSSESEKEKDSKPRPKTIIVKAKPNDSELEVGSSEAEKSESDEEVIDNGPTNEKRVGKRKSFTKENSSRSEASLESSSGDEDYSPRTKKKLNKNVTSTKATPQRTKAKKEKETKKKTVTDSESEKHESEDENVNLAERAKKIPVKSTDKTMEKDDDDSKSSDEADSSDESDDKNKKNGKRKSGSKDQKQDNRIKMLKRYITTAGIRVRYDKLWSDCKNNTQRINRMKQLLEENGIKGRPTLEKCKKLKAKNLTKKEIAELDTSNIISEGRVTRARSEAKKASLESDTKQREARNLFKRIQPVCDSDTE